MVPMSLNNIVFIVTASVSKKNVCLILFVHIFMLLVSEFDRYLKMSACGPVFSGLVCLYAGAVLGN